jgi:transposase
MNASSQLSKINTSLGRIKEPEIRERLMLLKHYYKSKSLRETAQEYKCSHGKIKYWKDRYEKEGLKGLYTQDRSGRPPSVDPKKLEKIKNSVEEKCKEDSWDIERVREYIEEKSGIRYTVRHTSRIVHSWGLAMIKPRPQYIHTASKIKQKAFLKEQH